MGLVLSQSIFALIHIPNRLLNGFTLLETLPNLFIVFLLGVLFAMVYLITDNLFLAMGVHTLINMPLLIFDGLISFWMVLVLSVLVLIFWNRLLGIFQLETPPS